jgi:hypothetical protein
VAASVPVTDVSVQILDLKRNLYRGALFSNVRSSVGNCIFVRLCNYGWNCC